ncbi:MAG: hypothetical protein LCH67_05695 [Bacteroidetes bacterium]|nr:hypothetical protein [Bacteroidota bacterium]
MDSSLNQINNRRLYKPEIDQVIGKIFNLEIPLEKFAENLSSPHYWGVFNTIWLLRDVARLMPEEVFPLQHQIFETMVQHASDEGIVRNGISFFENLPIDKNLEDSLFDFCFEKLLNHKSAVAIKAFSMNVCYNIALRYPDLLPELKIVIEDNMDSVGQNSPAIISRGRKMLRLIERHLNK